MKRRWLIIGTCAVIASATLHPLTRTPASYALPQQQVLRPTANGYYLEWGELWGSGTTHWDRVDDVTPDDAGSYIMDNTWNGTERDTYQLQDTTLTSIGSVEVVARATRVTTNDNNNVRLFIRSGSIDSESPVETLSENYWAEVSYSWTTDPATEAPWTQAGVNALQAGVRNAMGPSGGGGVAVTQVYVLVTAGAQILRPTANGTYTEWGELWGSGTTHWDRVEEVTPDDAGSYLMDNTWNGTERDTFQLSATSYTSITSVDVVARAARITTNDNNNVRLFIRSGTTDWQSPIQTLSMSWSEVSYSWTTNPATGQPWTQAAVNALQAGVQNAMGPSGGGGVGVTQVYVVVYPGQPPQWHYPFPSVGADNQYNYGGSYSRWSSAGAAAGFAVQINGIPKDQSRYNAEITDAASAYQAGVPVYIYFCIYPSTSMTDLSYFAQSLANAGVFNYVNAYVTQALLIVFDIEDGSACGSWSALDGNGNLDLSLVGHYEDVLHWDAQVIINYAQAYGLSPNRAVGFSSTPGIDWPFNLTGTTLLANWIANYFPLSSTGTYFPQLFGSHVDPSWGSNTAYRLQRFNNAGLAYSQTNPNWEDYGTGLCDSQSDIDSMQSWYLYLTNNQVNDYTWYPYAAPFCVP